MMWQAVPWILETTILVILIIYLVTKYMSRNFDYWKKRNVFFVKPTFLFGNFWDVARFKITAGEHLKHLYSLTREPHFGIYVFRTPTLVIRSPELIKQILLKDFNYFCDRTLFVGEHEEITKHLLLVIKNPEWKLVRSKVTPVFTSGKLRGMVPLINEIGDNFQRFLNNVAVSQEWVEVKEICSKFTTDVIAKCAFAINAHALDDEDAEFRAVGRLIFDFKWSTAIQRTSAFFAPILTKLFRMRFINAKATDFLRDAFWEAIKLRKERNHKGNDVIDCIIELMENEKFCKELDFKNDKVVAQAVQFFSAGFETSSSIMAFTLYELCVHPHIQNKLRAEIKETLQNDGEFTFDNVMNMRYLHMCVSETLRKYPVLPFLDRRCNSDYKLPGSDLVIEKGTPVYIPMFGLHYDPEYFPDPDKYDPERFSDENIKNIVPFSYIPFGEGPRICIGERFGMMSTKLGLVHFLSEFEVERTTQTSVPIEFEPKSFIVASKTGLKMKVKKYVATAS